MSVQTLRNRLEQQKGAKLSVERSLTTLQSELEAARFSLVDHEEAREIIRKVGLDTQAELEVNISDIVTLALESVFGDSAYKLGISFIQRRSKTECDLYFERDGNRVDPLTSSGVGAVDVAAYALRIASWSMSVPHSRNCIILDEPFRFLSENYQEQAAMMLKEISNKLGIQLIIVTHEPTLTTAADRVFNVSIKKGISNVKQV
jgi:DNA repair exonuclease SbcCD ATPase subunit